MLVIETLVPDKEPDAIEVRLPAAAAVLHAGTPPVTERTCPFDPMPKRVFVLAVAEA